MTSGAPGGSVAVAIQGRLARQGIAVEQTGIFRIENETRYVMDYEAVAIARALRVSVAWLLGEEQ